MDASGTSDSPCTTISRSSRRISTAATCGAFARFSTTIWISENQAGTRGLKLAASKGLGVVIMEPLLGGRLVEPPTKFAPPWKRPCASTVAEWALGWLWDQPEVSVVLSGIGHGTVKEISVRFADRSRVHSFPDADQQLIAQVREMYRTRSVIPATGAAAACRVPTA